MVSQDPTWHQATLLTKPVLRPLPSLLRIVPPPLVLGVPNRLDRLVPDLPPLLHGHRRQPARRPWPLPPLLRRRYGLARGEFGHHELLYPVVATVACAGGHDRHGHGLDLLEWRRRADELFLAADGSGDRLGGGGGEYG